jgi:hypothetical protein
MAKIANILVFVKQIGKKNLAEGVEAAKTPLFIDLKDAGVRDASCFVV